MKMNLIPDIDEQEYVAGLSVTIVSIMIMMLLFAAIFASQNGVDAPIIIEWEPIHLAIAFGWLVIWHWLCILFTEKYLL